MLNTFKAGLPVKTLSTLLFAAFASGAIAAVEPVKTGTPLDIAKTISVTDTSKECGVVPVLLVYEDSKGQRHTASYSVLGSGCEGD